MYKDTNQKPRVNALRRESSKKAYLERMSIKKKDQGSKAQLSHLIYKV